MKYQNFAEALPLHMYVRRLASRVAVKVKNPYGPAEEHYFKQRIAYHVSSSLI